MLQIVDFGNIKAKDFAEAQSKLQRIQKLGLFQYLPKEVQKSASQFIHKCRTYVESSIIGQRYERHIVSLAEPYYIKFQFKYDHTEKEFTFQVEYNKEKKPTYN